MKIRDVLFEFAPGGGGDAGDYLRTLASAWYNGAYDSGSLQKGIKSQADIERLLNRGIVCPDGVTRKYAIDYNSDFDGVVISSDDYYEHSDYNDKGQEVDSRTGQPWGPYDHMEFKDEELDEGFARRPIPRNSLKSAQIGYTPDGPLPMADYSKYPTAVIMKAIADLNQDREKNSELIKLLTKELFKRRQKPGVAEGNARSQLGDIDPNGHYIIDDTTSEIVAGPFEVRDQAMAAYKKLLAQGRDVDFIQGRALIMKLYHLKEQGVAEGSLNEFAPAGGGGNIPRGPKTPRRGPWDDNEEDPYQLRRYNRSADFFDQFDSDGVDKQKFDKATGEYEGYYFDRDAASGITQIAYFKFDDPTKIGDNDPGIGWYYEPIDEGFLNEFAPDSNDGGEEDALHKYAKMWWAGDEATQMQIERALAKIGWEIGEDEGSYDNGGVFVVRAGDVNGNSYISWPSEELTEGSDPWGSPGRFVGDTGPAQVSTTVPRHEFRAGDRVMYKPTGARATIENLYKNGTVARIHVTSGMGGKYFDAKVADLRPISQGLADEGATVTTTPGSAEPGGAVDNFKQQMANRTEIDYLKNLAGIKESRDTCAVCGQTPCNCTH